MAAVSLSAQIACVRREVMRRAEQEAQLLESGRLTQAQAAIERDAMVAVLETLVDLQYPPIHRKHEPVVMRRNERRSGSGLPSRPGGG